jgi:hypothetical protein
MVYAHGLGATARTRRESRNQDALDDTFEDWEQRALAAIGELTAAGRRIRKVPIDVDALAVWCRHQDRRLDSEARAAYVTHVLQAASCSVISADHVTAWSKFQQIA